MELSTEYRTWTMHLPKDAKVVITGGVPGNIFYDMKIKSPSGKATTITYDKNYRIDTINDLAAEREHILSGLTIEKINQKILDDLAKERNKVLDDLAKEREQVFQDIRGDNAGPTLVLRTVVPDFSQRDVLLTQAMMTKDKSIAKDLRFIASLEETFAKEFAAAQQVVQDAIISGAEAFPGDAIYRLACQQRGIRMTRAIIIYNIRLPHKYKYLSKQINIAWGM